MIYVLISKNKSHFQKLFLTYIKETIKSKGYDYCLIFCEQHIVETQLSEIDLNNDILIWEPIVAYNNLELLKQFQNNIVVLEKQSIYVQKISKFNPVNENMAINHGFYLMYIFPDEVDITNDEWKLVVKDDMFLLDVAKLYELIENQK